MAPWVRLRLGDPGSEWQSPKLCDRLSRMCVRTGTGVRELGFHFDPLIFCPVRPLSWVDRWEGTRQEDGVTATRILEGGHLRGHFQGWGKCLLLLG